MAINDVSLTAGMRSNLLSLQSTVNLLDRTQTRLSTGKKVNTAIDNPTSFFAAQSLNSRASTIDSLKDAMGQAVQTIAAADKGIKAIASLIEQAKGIAQSALSAADGGATATGVVSLSAISATGGVGFTTGTITLTDLSDGDHMHLYSNDARDSGQTFLSRLVPDPLVAGEYQLTGGDMIATAAALAAEINDTNWAGMPDPDYYYTAHHNAGTATVTISRFLQSDDSQVDVVAGDFATMFPAKYSYVVNPAAGSADTIDIGGVTFTAENSGTPGAQEFYVSGNDLLDTHSLALAINTYDWSGEVATFNATVENGELFLSKVDNATGLAANVVAGDFDASGVTGGGVAAMTVEEGSSELSNLQDQYNTLCDQLTELAEDSGYKGKNLLSATASLRQMVVKFEGTVLTVGGFDATAGGLGVNAATWTTGGDIDADLVLLDDALSTLRQESSQMSGNLSIITVRQEFSTNMIDTLTDGADKLTLADANEEGANMLMLQTRQSLSTTALSLSAQAAQSVLRLFQ